MIIDEDVYLEHFGVKGMQWGVRKSRDNSDSESSSNHKKAKIAGAIVVGTAVTAGTLYAVRRHQVKSLSTIPNFSRMTSIGQKTSQGILKQSGSTRIDDALAKRVVAARKNARSGASDHQKIMKRVAANHLQSVKETNSTLKKWYNDSNVPIPKRELLDTKYWERIAG